jgi:hypothetical protein
MTATAGPATASDLAGRSGTPIRRDVRRVAGVDHHGLEVGHVVEPIAWPSRMR